METWLSVTVTYMTVTYILNRNKDMLGCTMIDSMGGWLGGSIAVWAVMH